MRGNISSPKNVSVGTTATLISGGGIGSGGFRIKNNGAGILYVGASDVTASGAKQGWEIAAGAEFHAENLTGSLYGIVASGTANVKVWESSAVS